MISELLQRLTDLLGAPCLSYLLGLSEVEPKAGVQAEDLNDRQVATLQMLGHLAPADQSSTSDNEVTQMSAANWLGTYLANDHCTLAVALRRAAGGAESDLTSDDPLVRQILPVLRDLYALLLLSPREPYAIAFLAGPLHRHPLSASVDEAVIRDGALKLLFPDFSNGTPSGSYLGPNRGGTLGLLGFAGQLIETAFDWARLKTATPTLDAVASELESVIDALRRAVRGGTVSVPTRIALTGVLLPEDFEPIKIGNLVLRPRDRKDDWLVERAGGDRKLVGTSESGEQIEISYAGDIILEMVMDYRIHIGTLGDDGEWPQELLRLRKSVDERVDSIRLALALTKMPGSDPALVLPSWEMSSEPIGVGPNSLWREVEQNPKLVPRRLTHAEADDWTRWASMLLEYSTENVAIAVRRVLTALGERSMQEDVLIDSIMAWENMFGAEQETTFRVCAALGWLLEEDVERRKTLFAELKKIYTLRSRIVHGSTSLDGQYREEPRRALEVAIEALRAILERRPDLLGERDGPSRSNRLLLGD